MMCIDPISNINSCFSIIGILSTKSAISTLSFYIDTQYDAVQEYQQGIYRNKPADS